MPIGDVPLGPYTVPTVGSGIAARLNNGLPVLKSGLSDDEKYLFYESLMNNSAAKQSEWDRLRAEWKDEYDAAQTRKLSIERMDPLFITKNDAYPNKISEARWRGKTAWRSDLLLARQSYLETYSYEVEMVFEVTTQVIDQLIRRAYSYNELDFIANFGSPFVNNEHKISVILYTPFSLMLQVIRSLNSGRISWAVDVTATPATPANIAANVQKNKLAGITVDLSNNKTLPSQQKPDEKPMRSVRL